MRNIAQQQQTLPLGSRPLLDKLLRCWNFFRRETQPDETYRWKTLSGENHRLAQHFQPILGAKRNITEENRIVAMQEGFNILG